MGGKNTKRPRKSQEEGRKDGEIKDGQEKWRIIGCGSHFRLPLTQEIRKMAGNNGHFLALFFGGSAP